MSIRLRLISSTSMPVACDVIVYQSARALGYEPVLYVYYQDQYKSVIIDRVVNFPKEEELFSTVCREVGFPVINTYLIGGFVSILGLGRRSRWSGSALWRNPTVRGMRSCITRMTRHCNGYMGTYLWSYALGRWERGERGWRIERLRS